MATTKQPAEETALAPVSREQHALAEARPQPTVGEMMQAIIDKGINAENVAVMGELMKLHERMEGKKAERTASQALRLLQQEAKHVVATQSIPDKSGGIRFKYAPYEKIMEQTQPLLDKYGFSVRFSQKMEGDRETITCILTHDDGHVFTNEFTVRIGQGPPGATATQADSSAGTVAQREAFCDALNIVRRKDDDARLEGAPITKDQAFELERRVGETNSNREAFLKYAGAKSYAEIAAAKYAILDEFLARKEGRKP